MFEFITSYLNNTKNRLFPIEDKTIKNEPNYIEQKSVVTKTNKTFYVWSHKDDILTYLNSDEIEKLNIEFQNAFIYNKYLDNKYNSLLGIREYDTQQCANYKEISDLYKNGLTINTDDLDLTSQKHPMIQSTRIYDMPISPRLENYFNNSIHSFYITSIIEPKIKFEDAFDYTHIFELEEILK